LLDKFLQTRPSGTSPKTIQDYHYCLDKLIGYPLSPEGINHYLNDLTCHNGKVNHYSAVRSLCNWLYQNGYIPDNPIKRVFAPRRQRKLLPAVTEEQLRILLNHCICDRNRCLIKLLFDSGIRVSEIANIRVSDFNWEEGTVVILGKGNKERRAVFTCETKIMLREWFSQHSSFEISKAGIQTMLKRLGKATGIPCSAHNFRRGFCVHQVKRGLSTRVVQTLGGWQSILMVERYSRSLDFDSAFKLYKEVH
jgi:integrase/recombinase XerD